ncbi:unnamed protein product [Closterium sp. NIES-53]
MPTKPWPSSQYGPASGRTQANSATNSSTAIFPLLAKAGEPDDEDVKDVYPPPPLSSPVPAVPPLVADFHASMPALASSNEGSLGALPAASASGIAGGQHDVKQVGMGERLPTSGKPTTRELSAKGQSAEEPRTEKKVAGEPTLVRQLEVPVNKPGPRQSGRLKKAPERLSYHACLPPAAFTILHDDAQIDVMKNQWVLMTKYHVDDMVARKKARLVVKGFTEVYDADYDKTNTSVGSYVTLRIFLSVVAVLYLHLMQLDMKNASP